MLRKVFWRRPEGRAKGETLSDKELARKLRSRISGELRGSGSNSLRFYVREGVVTIYGSVPRSEDRIVVKHLAANTPGVVTVFDHLAVDDGDPKPVTRS